MLAVAERVEFIVNQDIRRDDILREFGFAVYFIELRPFHVFGLSLDSSREVVHLIFGVICL